MPLQGQVTAQLDDGCGHCATLATQKLVDGYMADACLTHDLPRGDTSGGHCLQYVPANLGLVTKWY